jgi:hypothetical protein
MFYLKNPKPLSMQTEIGMYYEVVKFPIPEIAVCKHPVTRSALIKDGFADITDEVVRAGGLDEYLNPPIEKIMMPANNVFDVPSVQPATEESGDVSDGPESFEPPTRKPKLTRAEYEALKNKPNIDWTKEKMRRFCIRYHFDINLARPKAELFSDISRIVGELD